LAASASALVGKINEVFSTIYDCRVAVRTFNCRSRRNLPPTQADLRIFAAGGGLVRLDDRLRSLV
jgi:hypothetical protein